MPRDNYGDARRLDHRMMMLTLKSGRRAADDKRVMAMRARDDEGSSLIEAVVALFIASVVFLALTSSLLSAMKSSVFGRTNQQAVDFGARAVEDARQLGFGSLGHLLTDLAPANDAGSPLAGPTGVSTQDRGCRAAADLVRAGHSSAPEDALGQ